jgi:hypothetical protein
MTAEDVLAQLRLSQLELARSLVNVRDACLQCGVSRAQVHECHLPILR